ncbi:hypothetical protein [Eisenibacter elegans]|uniref:hypothetical protein n=1 Tax=Eisenibacter elegans TaxID=997 RepID=UPI00040085C7|nr:hypothetical protein [Eisenibacter elegans]
MKTYCASLLLSIVCCFFAPTASFAQGCSDAGFCTMGALQPDQAPEQASLKLRELRILHSVSITVSGALVQSSNIDIQWTLGQHWQLQTKLTPYQQTVSEYFQTQGLADAFLTLTRQVVQSNQGQLLMSVGAKIPLNRATLTAPNGQVLPMRYQSSLGTYDVVAGASWLSRRWLVAVGYQQPLSTPAIAYRREALLAAGISPEAAAYIVRYPETVDYQRGSDVMLRIERNFRSARWNGHLGLLNIYRLQPDRSRQASGELLPIVGTDGLVVNLLVGTGYQFSTRSGINFLIARQLYTRDRRADGLDRLWLANVGWYTRF